MILALLAWSGATMAQDANCVDVGILFENVGADLGFRALGNSKGVNLNDFDGDGDIDIYALMAPAYKDHVLFYPGESLLYLNQLNETGEMSFVEDGAESGLDDLCEDRASFFGDMDNDGLADVYLTINGSNLLLHNTGGGLYEDRTPLAGDAGHDGWSHQGFLFDHDKDGWLDLFFTNGLEDGSGYNSLLRNQRDGTWLDITDTAGVAGDVSGKGACVLDVDGDGWEDIFVTTGREYSNHLFINQGDGSFTDEAHARGVIDPLFRFGVGAVCGDLDNDGDPDILVVTHDKNWTGNLLYENRDGIFVDVAGEANMDTWIDGHGLALVDVDNDGLLDAIFSGLKTPPYLLINNGGMSFSRACSGAGIQQENGVSWGIAGGDLDQDGYPEIVLSDGHPFYPRESELFQNLGGENHWLGVEVRGTTHNPSAIGARVEVEAEGRTITRWVGSWSSFNSQGPLPLTIGLREATQADTVRVSFTNGSVVELSDVAADQFIEVVEAPAPADADLDGVPDEWDTCPHTLLYRRTDPEGCAIGQRGGPALALVSPTPHEVAPGPPTFAWESNVPVQAVVQLSVDGTFGPAGRFDLGPVTGNTYAVTDTTWSDVLDASDGTKPLSWRVVALDEDGGEAMSLSQVLFASQPDTEIHIPDGTNVFQPAHVVVDAGSTITWHNEAVGEGNLQNAPHDIQLIDPEGWVVSDHVHLDGNGDFIWTFDAPGTWWFLCHQHTGGNGGHSDGLSETNAVHHPVGPYNCMAGTVTVR